MTSPVKLSRERWEMLRVGGLGKILPTEHERLELYVPLEIDGITFLPATYVSDDRPTRSVYEKMAVWHDQHAAAFEGDDPAIVKMRESHEETARQLRARA